MVLFDAPHGINKGARQAEAPGSVNYESLLSRMWAVTSFLDEYCPGRFRK